MTQDDVPQQAVRGCDGCTLCCKVLGIPEIDKPAEVLCPHCALGQGCTIYATRPADCAEFLCGYLMEPALGPEWKPDVSHIVLRIIGKTLTAHVDTAEPRAWLREPYYSTLRMWARSGAETGNRVLVSINPRIIQILPNGERTLK